MLTFAATSRWSTNRLPMMLLGAALFSASATAANQVLPRVFPAQMDGTAYSDPLLSEQWYLQAVEDSPGGANLLLAAELTKPSNKIVVAVVDTGVLYSHEDLQVTLPGYDFVEDALVANDGDGRDADPSDPGDWISLSDIQSGLFSDACAIEPSSWHGTAVSGLLSATSDNVLGIAGAAPNVQILPVRVMGKCGGSIKDLIDGIRWSAGLPVDGVPDNPHPASIINLSLGYFGECSAAMQSTLDTVRARGITVVTAIGNGGYALAQDPYSPASCEGVLTVAASDRTGSFSSYNNRGAEIDVLAPGGTAQSGLLTLDDGGRTSAQGDSIYQPRYGSSMAVPLVSATAAMMVSVQPNITPNAIETTIKDTAANAQLASDCAEYTCSTGLLNSEAAVISSQLAAAFPTPVVSDSRSDNKIVVGGSGGGALHPVFLGLLLLFRRRRIAEIAKFV